MENGPLLRLLQLLFAYSYSVKLDKMRHKRAQKFTQKQLYQHLVNMKLRPTSHLYD